MHQAMIRADVFSRARKMQQTDGKKDQMKLARVLAKKRKAKGKSPTPRRKHGRIVNAVTNTHAPYTFFRDHNLECVNMRCATICVCRKPTWPPSELAPRTPRSRLARYRCPIQEP
jgi:hypothetical protein